MRWPFFDRQRADSWMTRIGLTGFTFFLVKGLLWILIPALLASWR